MVLVHSTGLVETGSLLTARGMTKRREETRSSPRFVKGPLRVRASFCVLGKSINFFWFFSDLFFFLAFFLVKYSSEDRMIDESAIRGVYWKTGGLYDERRLSAMRVSVLGAADDGSIVLAWRTQRRV